MRIEKFCDCLSWVSCGLLKLNFYLFLCYYLIFHYGSVIAENDTDKNTNHNVSCEQLLADGSFNLSVIINTEWKELGYLNVISPGWLNTFKFIKPSELAQLDEHGVIIGFYGLTESQDIHLEHVNLSRVVLIAITEDNISGLFLETNTTGLFKVLVLPKLEYVTTKKPILIAMKHLKAGFLIVMNCENLQGAVLNPATDDVQPDPLVVQEKLHCEGFEVLFPVETMRF